MTDQYIDLLKAIPPSQPARPLLIAISGFGGSGKSTLAKKLSDSLIDSAIISIDDFIVDHLFNRSTDWDGFDRQRFRREILQPAVKGQALAWGEYNWQENKITGQKTLAHLPQYLILEGCSILHPDLMPYYDFSIWIDLPLELATEQGAARDRSWGADHDHLWRDVWKPNEQDFFEKYHPEKATHYLYQP